MLIVEIQVSHLPHGWHGTVPTRSQGCWQKQAADGIVLVVGDCPQRWDCGWSSEVASVRCALFSAVLHVPSAGRGLGWGRGSSRASAWATGAPGRQAPCPPSCEASGPRAGLRGSGGLAPPACRWLLPPGSPPRGRVSPCSASTLCRLLSGDSTPVTAGPQPHTPATLDASMTLSPVTPKAGRLPTVVVLRLLTTQGSGGLGSKFGCVLTCPLHVTPTSGPSCGRGGRH